MSFMKVSESDISSEKLNDQKHNSIVINKNRLGFYFDDITDVTKG